MEQFEQLAVDFGNKVWGLPLFLLLLGCGVIFSVFTKFIQYRILTHGINVIRGKYDRKEDAGHISHFQALCAALSATIGLGNIAGVALAVQVGGPGAIFWMWVVGLFGMAIKFVECGMGTMFRNEDGTHRPGAKPKEEAEVSGGPMWYIQKGLAEPAKEKGHQIRFTLFRVMAVVFAAAAMISSFGAGNSFQAWNVAETLEMSSYGVPRWATGAVLSVVVSLVIIGGIKRIGNVAGKLVPFMCVAYVFGAAYIIACNLGHVPAMLALIVKSAFGVAPASGAFLGSTVMVAFSAGLRRALFSNEAGQGSAAIAHAAAKTDEPVREGVVAGIGPFVDTLIICTMTAIVILVSGAYTRPEAGTVIGKDSARISVRVNNDIPEKLQRSYYNELDKSKKVAVWAVEGQVQGKDADAVFADVTSWGGQTADNWLKATEFTLDASKLSDDDRAKIEVGAPVHLKLDGASMTRFAFDSGFMGLGAIVVNLGVILFAFSTMISWSYYGEKGAEFLLGPTFALAYKLVFVVAVFCACIIREFSIIYNMGDALCGLMVFANLPAVLMLFPRYLRAARDYMRRLDSGEMTPEK